MALALIVMICACQPEPTPFPVDIPTPPIQAPSNDAAAAPLRYALAANIRDSGYEYALSQTDAQIVYLDLDTSTAAQMLGTDYDIIVALGSYTDASISPTRIRAGLVLNTSLAPLDNPVLVSVIRRALHPQRIATLINTPGIAAIDPDVSQEAEVSPASLRAELANAGWPDGVDLQMTYASQFAVDSVRQALAALNITVKTQPQTGSASSAHLTLVVWTDAPPRPEQTELIPLVEATISYWAIPDLVVTFSPDGWPLAARP
jgi:hypothetical protein